MATVNESGGKEGRENEDGNEGSGDPSGRRLSRSAENILSGSSSRKGTSGRPASPQVSSKLSQGFKGLFNRKRDHESVTAESSPASTLDRPPVSYAEDLLNLPERPRAFNRVLQQIRSRPNMKKTPEGRSTSKLQAARTKSDGSDTEPFREEYRHKRGTISSRDGDNRSAHDDSDVVSRDGDGTPDACSGSLLLDGDLSARPRYRAINVGRVWTLRQNMKMIELTTAILIYVLGHYMET